MAARPSVYLSNSEVYNGYQFVQPVNTRWQSVTVDFDRNFLTQIHDFEFKENKLFDNRYVAAFRISSPAVQPSLPQGKYNVPQAVFEASFLRLAYEGNFFIRDVSLPSLARGNTDARDTIYWFQKPVYITLNDCAIHYAPTASITAQNTPEPANSRGESYGIDFLLIC